MSLESRECLICTTGFRPKDMDDEKCDLCHKIYPKERSMDEVMRKKKPDPFQIEQSRVFNEKVIAVIDDRLLELGILQTCDCGNLFHKKSAAQKQCSKCKENS